jgi:uncharacterized membrane protein
MPLASSDSQTSLRLTIAAVLPGLLLAILLLVTNGYEWWSIGLAANPVAVASYPFGSEEAMGEGGEYYANAQYYARAMLIWTVALAAIVAVFIWAVLRRQLDAALAAYVLLGMLFVASWLHPAF